MQSLLKSFAKPVVFGTKLARHLGSTNKLSWIKTDIMKMGPAYIKIGQFVAAREDIFPEYITTELSDLHDNVNPIDFGLIKQTIEEEYNSDINEIFLTVNNIALSAASIGQVHIATLAEYPQLPLVIKVQKPEVREQFHQDFTALRRIINVLNACFPQNQTYKDLYNIVVQCELAVQHELDYTNEVDNLKQMRRAFQDSNITVPRVISKLSTNKVILMEYVQSHKLNDILDQDDKKDASIQLMKSTVMCGMKYGIIHGDLHPGNVGVLEKNKFVLYDCGLVVKINPKVLQEVFSSILSKNNERFIKALLDNKLMYIDEEPIGTIQLNRVVRYIMEYMDDVDIDAFFNKIKSDRYLNTGMMKFHIDPNMFLVSRTLSLLEGTCKSVDTDFSYNDIILDMVTDMELITEYVDTEVLLKKALIDFQKLTRINVIDTTMKIENTEPSAITDETARRFTPLELVLFVLLASNILL